MPSAHPADTNIRRVADLFNALDSPQRVHILYCLAERDHVVHELVEILGKSQPLVSQHLRVLKKARLVEFIRRGRESVYSLAHPSIIEVLKKAALLDELLNCPESTTASNHPAPVTTSVGRTITGKAAMTGPPGQPSSMPGLNPNLAEPPTPTIF